MNFTELQLQIKKSEPTLSAEGLMLVELFMPFCEALVKENADVTAIKQGADPIQELVHFIHPRGSYSHAARSTP